MKTRIIFLLIITFAIVNSNAAEQAPPPIPAEEQPETLTSGPMHEAYAEPVNLQDQPGLIAPVQPPANINEMPPTEKPQGGNYFWVPGYWAWDSERNSYIWVSGCWRQAPPNTYWVPGYWTQVSGGWEWVAGFWAPIGSEEIEYLPQPPAVEYNPPANPPTPDSVWVPPCWYWNQTQYISRPGYWLAAQADWVWMPSHYTRTPRGYVFIAGHWDYPLRRRGVLFAPVYYPKPIYLRTGFFFSPSIVINIGNLNIGLFAYPRYRHYYFGDYYSDIYLRIGIYPWFEFTKYHTWCDPLFEYDRWHYRKKEPHWVQKQRNDYELRRRNAGFRPSRTYHEMEKRLAAMPKKERKNFQTALPFKKYISRRMSSQKFRKINIETEHSIMRQSTKVHNFREERHRWERPSEHIERTAPSSQRAQAPQVTQRQVHITRPERVKVSPPIVSRQGARQKGPPQRPAGERYGEGRQRAAPERGRGRERGSGRRR